MPRNRKMQSLLLILIFVEFRSEVSSLGTPCPEPSENCDCGNVGDVMCTGMEDIPSNLPADSTFLDLDSNPLGPILLTRQMDNLDNVSLEQLYMSGCGFVHIEGRSFSQQSELRILDLSSNNLKELDSTVFFGLTKLTTLFLTKTSLYEITSSVFVYAPNVMFLDMSGNMISSITNQLSSLTKLEVLLISSNKIDTFAPNPLENRKHLRRLDLYDNKLTIPHADWFKYLVANNGTLKLFDLANNESNPWVCCGEEGKKFIEFATAIPSDYVSSDQLHLNCSWPVQFQGRDIVSLSPEEVGAMACLELTTQEISEIHKVNSTTGGTKGVNLEQSTMMSNNLLGQMSDVDVALLFLLVGAITALVTAFIVVKYNTRQRKKAFDSFLQNLPNSKETEGLDEATVTTRTYRQDVPVYGSTGKVVDRHRASNKSNLSSPSDSSSEGSNDPVRKRKPPPYLPDESLSDYDGDLASGTNMNNSSSFHSYGKPRSGAFSNLGFTEGQSEDDELWDINTLR